MAHHATRSHRHAADANWLTRRPRSQLNSILLAKVQDDAGHGLYLYGRRRRASASPSTTLYDLLLLTPAETLVYLPTNYLTRTWPDIAAIGWPGWTCAAIVNQVAVPLLVRSRMRGR